MPKPFLTIATTFDLAKSVCQAGAWADEVHQRGDGDDAEGHELAYDGLEPLTPLPSSPDELDFAPFSSDSPPSSPPTSPPPTAQLLPVVGSQTNASNPSVDIPANRPMTHATAKRVAAAKARKRRKRVAAAQKDLLESAPRRKTSSQRYILSAQKSSITFNAQHLHHTENAYYGARNRTGMTDRVVGEDELLAQGWELFPWDGRSTVFFVDPEGRIIVILIGQPQDPDWENVGRHCVVRLKKFRELGLKVFGNKWRKTRRGRFLALPWGVSYGGGRMQPGRLAYGKKAGQLFQTLLNDRDIQRVVGFQSSALQTFCPKIFEYMRTRLAALFKHHTNLVRNFTNSIFPTISFNCGPKTECYLHRDFGNAPHLMCTITALGNFNPKTGGKFLAAEIKKIIEFPPNSSIAVPSASMTHGNTPIQLGEERYSLTQYCAGGLLRWVDCGFRSVKSVLAQPGGKKALEKIEGPPGSRWISVLNVFSNVSELISGGPHGQA